MAEYGYMYRSYSAYSSVRQETGGPVTKPFSPSVPKTNGNSEGYVTNKRIVPVTSRPYGDDYKSHDDDERHRQTSPVHGSPPRKVDVFHNKEASRPQRFSPTASTDWHQSLKPTAYNGANGYGDYGNNKEGHKPMGSPIRNDNYDGYNVPNGYGGYNKKEGHKPTGLPIRNDNYYDGYYDPDGYGDKEGRKPIGSPIKNDHYDGYNVPNGYGGYNKKGEHKPTDLPFRNDHYDGYNIPDGYGGYNKKEGHKPTSLPIKNDGYNDPDGYGGYNRKGENKPTSLPIRNDNYDGDYNVPGGYGGYNKKEGHKPTGFPIRNDNYDGYKGPDDGYNKKKGHKPTVLPTRKDNYDDNHYGNNNKEGHKPRDGGGWSRPKISSGWTASPRKGTQLSEPTHDIEKAMELLKMEAAKHENSNKHDVRGHPQSKSYVPIEPNKDDYGKTIERSKDPTTRPFGNWNLPSRPRTSSTVFDDRDGDYTDDTRGCYGQPSVMDSKEAEKKFKGTRVS